MSHGWSKIGRTTLAGAVTMTPTPTAESAPMGITAGASGSIWFTELSVPAVAGFVKSGSGPAV
jgi:streptogramin lyase